MDDYPIFLSLWSYPSSLLGLLCSSDKSLALKKKKTLGVRSSSKVIWLCWLLADSQKKECFDILF